MPLGALVAAGGAAVDGGGPGHLVEAKRAGGWVRPGACSPLHRSVRPARLHRSFVHLLDQPVAEAEFLAVDTETNGMAGDLCELTEVGAVLVGGGELHETFDSLVRTERPLARGIQRFTGITQAMVDSAPPPRRGARGARRAARRASAGRPHGQLRPARAAAGVRALRARLAQAAGALHGPAGAPLRAAGPQALAGAAGGLARHRGGGGAPRAAGRAHLRARVLRAVPARVRQRRDGRRRRWSC